jgi:hypothetical protein
VLSHPSPEQVPTADLSQPRQHKNNTLMMSKHSTPHLIESLDLLGGRIVFVYSSKGRRIVPEENKIMVRRLAEATNEGNRRRLLRGPVRDEHVESYKKILRGQTCTRLEGR